MWSMTRHRCQSFRETTRESGARRTDSLKETVGRNAGLTRPRRPAHG